MTVLIIPKKSITEISDEYVKIEIPDKELDNKIKQIKWDKVEQIVNSLDDIYGDPIEYQNQIRNEWEKRLEKQYSRH